MFDISGGMCASTSSENTPSRLRHASAPDSLPSYDQLRTTTAARPFCFEAEDVYDGCRCRRRCSLAGWEERVLRAREERQWRRDKKIALVSAAAMKGQETERTAHPAVVNGSGEGEDTDVLPVPFLPAPTGAPQPRLATYCSTACKLKSDYTSQTDIKLRLRTSISQSLVGSPLLPRGRRASLSGVCDDCATRWSSSWCVPHQQRDANIKCSPLQPICGNTAETCHFDDATGGRSTICNNCMMVGRQQHYKETPRLHNLPSLLSPNFTHTPSKNKSKSAVIIATSFGQNSSDKKNKLVINKEGSNVSCFDAIEEQGLPPASINCNNHHLTTKCCGRQFVNCFNGCQQQQLDLIPQHLKVAVGLESRQIAAQPRDCSREVLAFRRPKSSRLMPQLTWLLVLCLVSVTSGALISSSGGSNSDLVIPRVCKVNINIDHRTRADMLAQWHNCTVLEGSLQINSALKDYQKADDTPPFSFPNLVEITDYLLLFRANQIANLSQILPKLAVIRGHRLVHNSALAVYQMKNLKTLGLYSLTSILRGGVRIEKNPGLCYVNTINWKNILMDDVVIKNDHIFIEENMDSDLCMEDCNDNCGTHCWDSEHCQIRLDKCLGDHSISGQSGLCYRDETGEVQPPCSSECLGGCTSPNSPEHCYACRNVWYNKRNNKRVCVDKCPEDFLSYKDWKCISGEDCMSLRNPDYDPNNEREEDKLYKMHTVNLHTKQCVSQCPANYEAVNNTRSGRWECKPCDDCPRWCDGGVINSREEAERYKQCTHIHGSIEIRISESDISTVLEETMKDIKVIEKTFKVTRSFALVSLFFFKSLEQIQNQEKEEFSVIIMENDNLQKLFPRKVTVDSGYPFIHYNQKLCMNDIEKFISDAGMVKKDVYAVSDVTNGNKAACSKEKLEFNITKVLSRVAEFKMSDYRRNLAETKNEDLNSLIGYEIFYREITEEQYKAQEVNKYEGLDACGSNIWNVIDKRPTTRNSTSRQGSMADWYKESEKGFLQDLKPFTPYAVYANTLMVPHLATKATGAQSDVIYFRTASEPPEEIQRLKWSAEVEDSLSLSWRPPEFKHGIIDHYDVQVELIQLDNERMKARKYCDPKKPNTVDRIKPSKKEEPITDESDSSGRNDTCPLCTCDAVPSKVDKIVDRGEDHIDEQQFYNDLINKIFVVPRHQFQGDSRRKRSVDSGSGNSIVTTTTTSKRLVVVQKLNGISQITHWKNETALINGTKLYSTLRIIVKDTNVNIQHLKHFSYYQVKVMACHKPFFNKIFNVTQKYCSPETIAEAKTKQKDNADDIVMENEEIDIYMANETTTGKTFIRWIPPSDPNQMITHYTVRTTKTLSDESTNHFLRCIPLSDIETLGNGWVQTKLQREGEIWVSLRAVSMYGPGKWTKWQWAMVNSNSSYTWVAMVVVIFVLFILSTGLLLYWRQRKKKESTWTYVSPNPDYIDTGIVYRMDEWEVARELITKGEELGSGSFGVCYRGIYNHAENGQVPVAIKSVPEHATFRQRIEFLTEASVMKDINTEYVVRLIGVVSQGQPTLVLMELMENGDLRKYLRNLRPDTRDDNVEPPTLQRILQMALEIADGMAYLSVRKYVHRDLAARNCLVSANYVVKVGDFGMAQDVYEKEYYRTEGRRLLPVRWMAPESLRDGKFTSKSDVWSYGVVLWEMATLAEQPYQGWGNDEVVTYVKEGSIMPRPDRCPDRLYELMRECWERNEEMRPSFLDICERLHPAANEHYHSNSFYLSSQGVEAVVNQRAQRESREESTHNTTPLNSSNLGTHSDNNGSVTTNGGGGSNGRSNAAAASTSSGTGNGGPTISFRSSPTHISFSAPFSNLTGGFRSSANKTTANGLGMMQRLRNKSGSSSGNAAAS